MNENDEKTCFGGRLTSTDATRLFKDSGCDEVFWSSKNGHFLREPPDFFKLPWRNVAECRM